MSDDANLLSNRDSSGGGEKSAPTVASINLRVLLSALERIGHDVTALKAEAALSPEDLEDPDARFPVYVYTSILARAQQRRPMPNLALHVAAATPIGAYPVTDYLVVTSDSVGQGFRQLARYFVTAGAPVSIELDEARDPIRILVNSPANPWGAEYTIALHILHTQREADGPIRVEEIAFHHEPEDPAEWRQTFRCAVSTAASWTGFALPRAVWHLPFRRRDPNLRAVLQRHAEDVLAKLPPAGDLIEALRRALATRVAGGDTRIAAVARHLAMTPRTLQRRLAEAGIAYHDLLDEMRRRTAQEHLEDSTLSIGEIAYLLGYSDRAAFHKAVRRWTGLTPQAYRARHSREITP
jgi:AraC-like DNA-binding protein